MTDAQSGSGGYAVPVAVAAVVVAAAVVGGTVVFADVEVPLGDEARDDERQLSMAFNEGTAVVTFEGGNDVDAGEALLIRVEGDGAWTWAELDADVKSNDPITAGETVGLSAVESGDRVTVVWQGDGESDVVAQWTA